MGRVASLRTRLNRLAWQQAIFCTLAILIVGAAAVYAGAYLLSPLAFLVGASALVIVAALSIAGSIRGAWRMRASGTRAAAIADDRADLKGRLATIVALENQRDRRPLWPYLVEDTLGRQEQFALARIERRRVSPAIYALFGAIVMAVLVVVIARMIHAPQIASGGGQDELTIDLNDLDLRPADPGDESGMQVTADAATMRRLEDKLAREGGANGAAGGGSLNQLVNRAREMAGNLQSKLTGQQTASSRQRLNLRLADAGGDQNQNQIPRAPETQKNRPSDAAGQFRQDQPDSNHRIDLPNENGSPKPDSAPSSGGDGESGVESDSGKDQRADQDASTADRTLNQSGENGSNGGATHGVGVDPDSLFGSPEASKLGSEGFEIAIEARPVDRGAPGAGRAYVAPKVRTPLNVNQEPDEPVARAAVPAEDRATVKRVFER